MTLTIASAALDKIKDHARTTYPMECCGLLLGRVAHGAKTVLVLRPMENSRADSPRNRYLITPKALLEAEKEARGQGLDIVGVYHSHPDHPARPSEFDREHGIPWYSYVILSVERGEPHDLTSWVLREDRSAFDSEDLQTL